MEKIRADRAAGDQLKDTQRLQQEREARAQLEMEAAATAAKVERARLDKLATDNAMAAQLRSARESLWKAVVGRAESNKVSRVKEAQSQLEILERRNVRLLEILQECRDLQPAIHLASVPLATRWYAAINMMTADTRTRLSEEETVSCLTWTLHFIYRHYELRATAFALDTPGVPEFVDDNSSLYYENFGIATICSRVYQCDDISYQLIATTFTLVAKLIRERLNEQMFRIAFPIQSFEFPNDRSPARRYQQEELHGSDSVAKDAREEGLEVIQLRQRAKEELTAAEKMVTHSKKTRSEIDAMMDIAEIHHQTVLIQDPSRSANYVLNSESIHEKTGTGGSPRRT